MSKTVIIDYTNLSYLSPDGESLPVSQYEMIRDFHIKFELAYDGPSRSLTDDYALFRIGFMIEELAEYAVAAGYIFLGNQLHALHSDLKTKETKDRYNNLRDRDGQDLEKQFDALIDLVYVALGTSHLHGFQFDEGFARVHLANMKKVRVLSDEESAGSTGRGSKYDVKKPEGWTPADLSNLI